MLHSRIGLRRLRPGTALVAFANRRYTTDDGEQAPEPLAPSAIRGSETEYLLPEFCSHPLPRVHAVREGSLTYYILDPEQGPLAQPSDIVIGFKLPRSLLRYRRPDRPEEWNTGITRLPCKTQVTDVLIHRDVYPGMTPLATAQLFGFSEGPRRLESEITQVERVPLSTPLVPLAEVSARALRLEGLRRYPELVLGALEGLGLGPGAFRGFRCHLVYPVPFIALTLWFPLPERPETFPAAGRQ